MVSSLLSIKAILQSSSHLTFLATFDSVSYFALFKCLSSFDFGGAIFWGVSSLAATPHSPSPFLLWKPWPSNFSFPHSIHFSWLQHPEYTCNCQIYFQPDLFTESKNWASSQKISLSLPSHHIRTYLSLHHCPVLTVPYHPLSALSCLGEERQHLSNKPRRQKTLNSPDSSFLIESFVIFVEYTNNLTSFSLSFSIYNMKTTSVPLHGCHKNYMKRQMWKQFVQCELLYKYYIKIVLPK